MLILRRSKPKRRRCDRGIGTGGARPASGAVRRQRDYSDRAGRRAAGIGTGAVPSQRRPGRQQRGCGDRAGRRAAGAGNWCGGGAVTEAEAGPAKAARGSRTGLLCRGTSKQHQRPLRMQSLGAHPKTWNSFQK